MSLTPGERSGMIKRTHSHTNIFISFGLILLVAIITLLGSILSGRAVAPAQLKRNLSVHIKGSEGAFVTRSGTSLLLNGKKFRFSGANIYWVGLEETDTGNKIGYPRQ